MAKIYDLLGILSPIVVRCKILLQEIWIQNYDWDDKLNEELKLLWLQIRDDFNFIRNIHIPRYVFTSLEVPGEVHGFADASQRAYGCCIYFRVAVNGKYQTTLLIAKSKVAPIKTQSLPRLELCAAVLLNKTWQKIQSKMADFVSHIYFWTDSKIVLQWLKLHSSTLNCFVANRVSELQNSTKGIHWRHVPSKSNPADIVSRGCSAQDLSKTIWFNGPHFLQDHHSYWPQNDDVEINLKVLEKRKTAALMSTKVSKSPIEEIIDKHSSYLKILRIISFIFRVFNRRPLSRNLKQQFWKAWSRYYLLSLPERNKWLKVEPNIIEGQLVVIHEDNTPPQQWQLARVSKAILGPDGRVRVVELKSKNGLFRRPIHKVAPLPPLNSS